MKDNAFQPAYIQTHEKGLLKEKVEIAGTLLKACTVCPRKCAIDRTSGETGYCRTTDRMLIASYGPHFGEERPLIGRHGSGTIFVSNCNMGCVFCQNAAISHAGEGQPASDEQLSGLMIALQAGGCQNINFVSPSHVVPQIIKALPAAIEMGLNIPLVYNTGGYDALETLQLLDGVVDIYMPDFKYADEATARQYSDAPDYPEIVKTALVEMHRQTGELKMDENGIAQRGVLIRHLVLPENLAGTEKVMAFIGSKLSPDTYVNIMDQYHPCSQNIPAASPLGRRITDAEYHWAVEIAKSFGLSRIDGVLYPR